MTLVRGLSRSIYRDIARGLDGISDPILAAFADGTDGFYFDFSKTDRLFQDTSGQTAANSAGNNIAMALESHAWAGAAFPPSALIGAQTERTANPGPFTNTTNIGTSGTGTLSVVGDDIVVTAADGTSDRGEWTVSGLTVGRVYRAALRVKRGVGTRQIIGQWTWGTVVTSAIAAGSDFTEYTFYVAATATSGLTRIYAADTSGAGAAGDTVIVDAVSTRELPGNHGTQTTTSAQPKYQTGGLARFDGLDDNLLTTLNPSSPFTMVVKLKAGSATRGIMGITTGTNGRCFLQTATSGLLCGGVGANSTGVIVGGASILGAIGVAALTLNGTTNKLYWNGGEIYSGVQNGTPGAFPIALGAVNSSGTVTAFGDHDIYHALAIKKALTAAQITAITNKWGTT